ncbi:carboxypeptidase regulatory-like domain-containing protein [Flavobacterium sp.]|uniref:carboxypeptidase regulatory-like domain-containing protein n=1 Tax=Flavobacterium sp. TaxID=239 RepID=UPI003751A830
MKKRIFNFGFFLIAMIIFSCSKEVIDETGLGIVTGRVVKEVTFEPLANVKISSSPNSSTVLTDAQGNFTMQNVPSGNYSFEAQKDGYITKFEAGTVLANTSIEIVFELKIKETENNPPTIPILTSPIDNAIDQELNVNLTWTSSDPENNTLTYEITLRNDSNDIVQTFSDITVTNFTLINLNYATKYYWQVSVSDGTNPKVLSAISSFKTAIFPNARFLFVRKMSGNNVIFTANDTGNELQLTTTATNCYRPRKNTQANKIAFIKSDGAQEHIYTMKPDGSDVFKVTNSVPITGFNLDYINFSWSENGSQIIYPNFDKLYRINSDGSGLIQIYQTTNSKFISECDWSVDGSLIAIKINDVNGYNAEILVIDQAGNLLNTVITGFSGAIGGLHFSVNNQNLLFTRDISGYQAPDYRQLNTNIFMYNFITDLITQPAVSKPLGTNDLDVRFSPNEADLLFVNTSNDGVSTRYIQKYTIGGVTSTRVTLYTNCTMPDWK